MGFAPFLAKAGSTRSKASPVTKPLLAALAGETHAVPPIWLMRQAGRYLPEYRELRAKAPSFLDFCYTPAMAAEVTLQPIRRFGFDGAILFSDILVVPDALGQVVSFEKGAGPQLEPIEEPAHLSRLRDFDAEKLAPVYETIDRVKSALPAETSFIGFCGAPWTVASYMIAGHGTPDQAPARLFALRHPQAFAQLIDILVDASAAYLLRQIAAGVEAVQIFDSWAGVLPVNEFENWVLGPLERLIAKIRAMRPDIPIIAFVRGAGSQFPAVTRRLSGANAFGLDTAMDAAFAASVTPAGKALQGNLDPLALIVGGDALKRETDRVLSALRVRPHIFNLGHGILPETPIAHVEQLLSIVRNQKV